MDMVKLNGQIFVPEIEFPRKADMCRSGLVGYVKELILKERRFPVSKGAKWGNLEAADSAQARSRILPSKAQGCTSSSVEGG